MLSHDTLVLLYDLLSSVQLPVSHPEFPARAQAVIDAKAQLEAALAETAEVVDLAPAED